MRTSIVLASLAVVVALVANEGQASACGGCFHPPTENPTVVTDHRMVMTVAKGSSTLYDQIKYTGEPGSFAWVLPIAGTVDIGLSSDVLFDALDRQTQTQIVQPPTNCPAPPDGCRSFNAPQGSSSSSSGGASAGGGGVSVIQQETVGPYETVQLSVDNGNTTALTDWLTQNGYAIPDDVKPVLAAYVNEKFNFLALKLQPGKGVQDMRPVRVTTTGAGAVLPLRMVAAGTGATVGITLWVVAEGKYEPQNFPSFVLLDADLSWDWQLQKSNYVDLRASKTAAANGRIWEIENSTAVVRSTIESIVKYSYFGGASSSGSSGGADAYLPEKDSQGNVTKTAEQVRDEDLATLFDGIQSPRVTRLRADLAHAALDQDLQLTASADQSPIPLSRQPQKELNQPLCPIYDGCTVVGNAPRDQATAHANEAIPSSSGSSCAVGPSGSDAFVAASLGIVGLALVRARRRRR